MTYNQQPDGDAQPQEHEPLFFVRVLRIRDRAGVFIQEGRPRLRERNALLAPIGGVLLLVPFEPQAAHPL